MSVTEQKKHKKESSEIKKTIRAYEKEIQDNEKKINTQVKEIEKLKKEKLQITSQEKKITKQYDIQKAKNEKYAKRIKELNEEILNLKKVKFEEKNITKCEEIEDKIQLLELAKKEKNEQIIKIEYNIQGINEQLENFKKRKAEIKLNETVVTDDDTSKLLIKEKEVEIAEIRLKSIDLFIYLREEEARKTVFEFERSRIEETISKNKQQLIKEIDKLDSNKKTKKEVEMAGLDVLLKKTACEKYTFKKEINELLIENAKLDKEILKLYLSISKLEKYSLEITMKKDVLKQRKNNLLQEPIIISAEENTTFTKKNVKTWFGPFSLPSWYKKITNFCENSREKRIITSYQKKEKALEREIKRLEAKRLSDFWNKFWLVMSCGCYNNHCKITIKIEEKNRKLKEIKNELKRLSKNKSQISTSVPGASSSKIWNNELKSTENDYLLKEKCKNASVSLN